MSSTTARPFVLLVEDSEDDAYFFTRALRLSGFPGGAAHAIDGGAAIHHLQRALAGEVPVPDLVFLDLKIPKFNGFEVLEWINAQHFQPPLEIAVLSGSEQSADVERAMALGAAGYYVKPILVQQLKLRLATWQAKHPPVAHADEVAVASGRSASA